MVKIPEQNNIPNLRSNTRSRSDRLPRPLRNIKPTFLLLHHNRSSPLLNLGQPPGFPEIQRIQNRFRQICNYVHLLWSPVLHHARSFAPEQPPKGNLELRQQTKEKILIQSTHKQLHFACFIILSSYLNYERRKRTYFIITCHSAQSQK